VGTPPAVQNRRLLALWLMAASVLVWVPGGYSRFVLAKLLVVAVAAVVGATVPRDGRLPRPLVAGLAAGTVLLVAAALAGGTPVASLVGRFPRYEGLPVLGLYVAAAWLGARIGGRGAARAVQLGHALSGMVVVLAVASLLDLGDGSPLGPSTLARSGSLLGNATDQGLVAMMATLVAAGALQLRRDWLLLAGVAGGVVTVALSGSRVAMALTALGLVALAVRHRGLLRPVLVAVAGLVVVAAVVPDTRDRLLSSTTGRGRIEQWTLTLDLVRDHLFLGVGPSRYVDAVGRYETPEFVAFSGRQTLADSPHDVVLQAAVAGGLPLLACFLVLVALVGRRAVLVVRDHPESAGVLAAVAAYAVAVLANPTAAGPTCLAAFLTGVLVAEPAPAAERPWPRWGLTAVLAAAAFVLAASCVGEVRLGHGVDAARAGRVDDARSALDAAQLWRPWDSDVALVGAEATLAGDPEQARELGREVLDSTPDSYEALVVVAMAELRLGDGDAARRHLDRAAELFPQRRLPPVP
jgi:tetratricopeptide (TPR) repeat protein